MAAFIHRRNTPDGPRYRYWSTVVDRYYVEEMTRDEMVAYLQQCGEYQPERMERADERGTSCRYDTRDMDGPWDTELCHECGGFHHTYQPHEGGGCAHCGEPRGDMAHAPPCGEEAT